jgi:hypothetical protein
LVLFTCSDIWRRSTRVIIIAVSFLAINSIEEVSAQDTHYWTQQYGTQGELLLGTVVGSLIDLSAVYYNPGALALQDNPSLLLGAKAFEYQSIKFEDVEKNEAPLKSQSFGAAPTLFAGILPPKWFDGVIGYSVLTRQDFKFRLQATGSTKIPSADPDSVALLGGEILVDQDITGIWGGPTWSRAFGNMGVGASAFIAYQGQRTRYQSLLQGIYEGGGGSSATFINEIDYWHVRMVFKLGLAWDLRPLTFGFALTAPGIGLFGQGSALADIFVNGVDIDGDDIPDTELIVNRIKDEPSDYMSPGSIAAGASYRFKDTSLHVSAEWFDSVDKYSILPPVEFTSPTTGNTYVHNVTHELSSVFNWGFGIEQHVLDWFKVYGSFITDRSAYVEGSRSNASVTNWDLYHLMGGTAFTFLRIDVTLGIAYAFGSSKFKNRADFADSSGDTNIPLEDIDAKLLYSRWKFIVGFAFGSSS